MKKILLSLVVTSIAVIVNAQTYPEPEFTKEVYYLKKDSVYSLVRLEKSSSKMDTKTKMAGIGGSETGYAFDGERSSVRFSARQNLSFIFSNGSSASSKASSATSDSMMKANGVDPSMMEMMSSMNDPASAITLYKAESGKGQRKIITQKIPGASPFGSKKIKSSDKYTFSTKKIREGYWELVIDKPLPKGEYAFSMMNMMNMDAMGGTLIFAFAID